MSFLAPRTTARPAGQFAAKLRRCASARNGWDPAAATAPARESHAARTDHSPRGRLARTVMDQGFPAARALPPGYRKAYAPTSGPADSRLRLAPRDCRLLRAIRAALAARRHRRPRRAAIPGPSCARRDSDPCGPRPSGPAGFADWPRRPQSIQAIDAHAGLEAVAILHDVGEHAPHVAVINVSGKHERLLCAELQLHGAGGGAGSR